MDFVWTCFVIYMMGKLTLYKKHYVENTLNYT